jgi:hypothetical protein
MSMSFAFALKDWITWPVVFAVCVIIAILKKDHVRAALRLDKFQFSLEAQDRKLKSKLNR